MHRFSAGVVGAFFVTCTMMVGSQSATAQEASPSTGWDPHVLLEGFAGDDTGGDARAFIPFWQDPAHIAFLYPYYIYQNNGDFQAAGIGLGGRNQVSSDWLLGVYGFADWTRQYDEWWGQASVGVEALSPDWDLRLNGYIPYGEAKGVGASPVAILNEDNFLEILLGQQFGMYGVDGEVGYRLLNWGDNDGDNELRLFGGGYTWWHDDAETITGASGRVELRVNELAGFPAGSRFTLGAYGTYDNVDGAKGAVMASLRLPLGPIGGTSRHFGLNARMDEDIIRRWGGRIGGSASEAVPAYFVFDEDSEMRETGLVVFADGDDPANELLDGWTPPTATQIDDAITQAGTNGIIVALDQFGDIMTPGSTLLEGQAIIGGGTMFPVMTASGEMAYYLAPGGPGTLVLGSSGGPGPKFASVADPDTQFVLTLANNNTVFGIGIEASATPEGGGLDGVAYGGINGEGTTGAWIYGNTINLALEATGEGVVFPPLPTPGETIDLSGITYADGVADSSLIGIALAGSTGATIEANDITVSIDGTGGGGGSIVAGAGAGGSDGVADGQAGDENGGIGQTGGSVLAGNGGVGVKDSNAYGIDLTEAVDAMVLANMIDVSITGRGGRGSDATAGDGGNGGVGYVDGGVPILGDGGMGGLGGSATGGIGGAGLDNVYAVGIVAEDAMDATFTGNNDVSATLDGTGGRGGNATGGDGGEGGSGFDFGNGGNGGTATGGIAGHGITGKSTVIALDLGESDGATLEDNSNTLTASAIGVGGLGGGAWGGDGGIVDASESRGTGGSGAEGSGGQGGLGLDDVEIRGLDLVGAKMPWLGNNTIHASIDGTGGTGGEGQGGVGGRGPEGAGTSAQGFGGLGNWGISFSTIYGINAGGSEDGAFEGNTVGLNVAALGGSGGAGIGGAGAVASEDMPHGGHGADGTGGLAFQGIFALDGTAVELSKSTDAQVQNNQIGLAFTATGGAGGTGTGGDGGLNLSTNSGVARTGDGGDGGEGTGGNGSSAAQNTDFVGVELRDSTGGWLSGNSVMLSATGVSGVGGAAYGGAGGATDYDDQTARVGGTGGDATGGLAGAGGLYDTEILGIANVTDTQLDGNSVQIGLTGTGSAGGSAWGGAGGAGATIGSARGGAGGMATGGLGATGLRDVVVAGITFKDGPSGGGGSSSGDMVDLNVAGFGGGGGMATGGAGGDTEASGGKGRGGAGGTATGGVAGDGLSRVILSGVGLPAPGGGSTGANVDTADITVVLAGTGGIGGEANGGVGGDHNGTGPDGSGGRGGDAAGGAGGDGGATGVANASGAIGIDVSSWTDATILNNLVDVSHIAIGGVGGAATGGNGGDLTDETVAGHDGGDGGNATSGDAGHGAGVVFVGGIGGGSPSGVDFIGNDVTVSLSATGGDTSAALGGEGGNVAGTAGTGGDGGDVIFGDSGHGLAEAGQLFGLLVQGASDVEKTDNAVTTAFAAAAGSLAVTAQGGSGGTGPDADGNDGIAGGGVVGTPVFGALSHSGFEIIGSTNVFSDPGDAFDPDNTYVGAGTACVVTGGSSVDVEVDTGSCFVGP